MINRRLPTTTYGYTPPTGARANGWRCFNDGCHAGGQPAPRRWPAPCPECGGAIDPTFEEPWQHDAEGLRLAHQYQTSAQATDREYAGAYLYSWQYKDAVLRQDMPRLTAVKKEFGLLLGELPHRANRQAFQVALTNTAWDAAAVADLDFAADLLQAWHPSIHTDDVEENNQTRTEARSFIGACIRYLEHPESIGHAREQDVFAVMYDVKERVWEIINTDQKDAIDRVRHMRARIAEVTRIDQEDRDHISTIAFHAPLPHPSAKDWAAAGRPQALVRQHLEAIAAPVTDAGSGRSDKDLTTAFHALAAILSSTTDEPTTHWASVLLTDAAMLLADVHGDTAKLFTAADLITSQRGSSQLWRTTTGLADLLRAHGQIALMHNEPGNREQHTRAAQSALDEAKSLDLAAEHPILPAVRAVQGLLIVQLAQANGERDLHRSISEGIAECRAGRDAVAGLWRKISGADIALARLLVWRALLVHEHPVDRLADAQEAARLARRWSRPGQPGPTSAQVVHYEALRAQDALAGGADPAKRAKNWRTAVANAGYAPTAMRMRLAVAWVSWAVETDNPTFAAEAYEHLMSLIPLEAAARYRPEARQKVLLAAQEHTEEAGYWLARAGRYREAVVALETGRAISLSHLTSWDNPDLAARLERAGQSGLVAEYRGALADLAATERTSTGDEGPDSPLQHAWARARAAANRITEVTGRHPLTSGASYPDIVQINDDGAVIYIVGAKASGYALVVAGGHDPQYIHLPEASRAAIGKLVLSTLPGHTDKRPHQFSINRGLRQLAEMGIREILLFHARGRAVTLVPVGQLSLIPLHATSDQRGNYLGDYSPIRYAPNVRTLLRCRETARSLPEQQLRLLAVNVPEAHGGQAKRLANVARETAEINRIWAGHGRDGRVIDDCTWEEFRRTANDYSVWHIASHGATSPHGPSGSRISFADAEVTLEQMAAELPRGSPAARRPVGVRVPPHRRRSTQRSGRAAGHVAAARFQRRGRDGMAGGRRGDDLSDDPLLRFPQQG